MARTARRHAGVALLAASSQACGGQGSSLPPVSVRDSLGIEIVENRVVPELNAGGWQVDAEPTLTIDSEGGGGAYDLFDVRSVRRLSDQRIVVANSGNSEILFFDAGGVFERSIGRRGTGPGEFNAVSYIGRYGEDSLVVLDHRQRRISYFSAEGEFVGSTPVALDLGLALLPKGILADGRLLFGGGPTAESAGQLADGMNRQATRFAIASREGNLEVMLAEFAGSETYATNVATDLELWQVPYAKTPAGAASGNLVYIGTADRFEILVWDSRGSLIRIIRLAQVPARVGSPEVDSVVQDWISQDPESAGELRRRYSEIPLLDRMPSYARFIADSEGCLWVEEYPRARRSRPTWIVFGPGGSVQARISLPPGFELLDAGVDYVLGVTTNELGSEAVGLHRLTRDESRDEEPRIRR